MSQEYRLNSTTGDVVLLPNGKDLGIVTNWDIIEGGHFKIVKVFPLVGFWKRLIGMFGPDGPWIFVEDNINKLRKVGSIFNCKSPA